MRSFHPATILIFFAAMTIPSMIANNPVYTAVSLIGAVMMLLLNRSRSGIARELAGYFVILAAMSLLNPIFVHRGSTPLFFINGRAVTLEAALYGICSAMRLVTAVIWCRSFSIIMTSDRIFCLTGKLSPKISAVLTMTVRFIPDMIAQGRKISSYSRTSGKFGDSAYDRLRRALSVFSALVTWSIESAVMTADSMKARGFELSGRTAYSRFVWSAEDFVLIALSGASCAAAVLLSDRFNLQFYPSLNCPASGTAALIAAAAAAAAAFLFPIIFTLIIESRRGRRNENN